MSTVLGIIFALIFLGVIIAFHELGHFAVAKLTGIPVEEFSIGIGPRILHTEGKETTFSLRLLPIGGYVRYFSDMEEPDVQKDDPRAFSNAPVWKRLVTLVAGPLMNIILAFLIMSFYFAIVGINTTDSTIASVYEDTPAEGVFEAGDDIIAIDGTAIPEGEEGFLLCKELFSNGNESYTVTVIRNGETQELTITPLTEGDIRIGISFGTMTVKLSPLKAIATGVSQTVYIVKSYISYIGEMFSRGVTLDDFEGPVGIVSDISAAASEGIPSLLNMMILISISVGIFNFFPIPALDGGRILIYLIELIRGKRLSQKTEGIITMVGFALVFMLLIAVTVNDIIG